MSLQGRSGRGNSVDFEDTRPTRGTTAYRSPFQEDEEEGEPEREEELSTLQAPVEIGGVASESPIDSRISGLAGRASSPRLFSGGNNYPSVRSIQVHKLELGSWVSLGTLSAEATEEDLIHKFKSSMPRPGEDRVTFKFWPLGQDGRELGHESERTIGSDHAVLQALRAREAELERQNQMRLLGLGFAPVPPAPQTVQNPIPTELFGLIGNMMQQSTASAQAEQDRVRATLEAQAAGQQNAAETVKQLAQAVMASEAERTRLAIESMRAQSQSLTDNAAAFYQNSLEASRAAAEREVKSAQIAAERDKEQARLERELTEKRFQTETEREQVRLAREQAALEAKLAREQAEFDRKLAKQAADDAASAERMHAEHARRQAQLEAESKTALERMRIDAEKQREDAKTALEAERLRMEAQARLNQQAIDLQVANVKAQAEMAQADLNRRAQEFAAAQAAEREERARRFEAEQREREERNRSEREDRDRRERLDREERERKDRLEREDRERKEKIEQAERERKEKAEQRAHELELKRLEDEKVAKREHEQAMAQLQQMQLNLAVQAAQSAKGMQIEEVLAKATAMLAVVGVDPKQIVNKFLNPPPPPEPDNTPVWAELAGKVMTTVGEVAKAKMIAGAATQRAQGRGGQPRIPPPPPRIPPAPGVQNPGASTRGAQIPVPQPPPTSGAVSGRVQASRAPAAAVAGTSSAPNRPSAGAVAASPSRVQTPSVQAATQQPVDTTNRLNATDRSAAEAALANLVHACQAKPKDQWETLIIKAVTQERRIIALLQEDTVYQALLRAGASDENALDVVEVLQNHPLIDEMNWGVRIEYEDDEDEDEDEDDEDEDEDELGEEEDEDGAEGGSEE